MYLVILIISLLLFFRKDRYLSLIGFFFLLTDGFQFLPEQVPFISFGLLGKDFALIYLVLLNISFLFTPGKPTLKADRNLKIVLWWYVAYLVFAMVIDLVINRTPVSDFLLMTRHYLFLLGIGVFNRIDTKAYVKAGRTLIVLTALQSVLCLLQIPFGVKLLFGGNIGEYDEYGLRWIRYTNLPYFGYLFFFYLFLFSYQNRVMKYKYLILLLLAMTIFLTLTRTLILGVVLTLAIALLTKIWRLNAKYIVGIAFLVMALFPVLKERVASSFDDIEIAVGDGSDDRKMTFTYRMAHVAERFAYISSSPRKLLFGIGFIHERNFPPHAFLLGIPLGDGYSIQLEQDDIAWSNLIIRHGIVGTFLYVMIYLYLCVYFYKNKHIFISAVAFMYMTFSFFLTFASGRFSFADFYIIPFILYFIVKGVKNDFQSISKHNYSLI